MIQNNEQSGMRNFLIIASGQLVSTLGTGLTNFAISLWVLSHTGSVTQFGLLILIITLPGFFVTPLAGAAADRWSRRTVMILSDLGAGLSILILSLLFFTNFVSIWLIAAALAVSSVCGAFRSPAYLASVSLLVPKQQLGRANGIIQLGEGLGKILAPMLAGFLLVSIGVQGVILIDVFSFFFAVATLLAVRIPNPRAGDEQPAKAGLLREATEGWKFIKARPGMIGLLAFFAFLSFQMGMAEVLVPPMLLASASPAVVGTIVSVFGFGLLAGSIVMSTWAGPRRRIYGVFAFTAIQALALALAGASASLWLMGAGLFLSSFTTPLVNGGMRVLYQLKTPPEMQGRVFATASMVVQAVMPIAFAISGPLADKVFEPLMAEGGALAGSVGQVIGVGKGRGIGLMLMLMGLTVLVGVIVGYLYPHLRDIETELPDAIDPPPAAPAPAKEEPVILVGKPTTAS
jgi:MFS family permease